jgi:UDP:flavonoid glycosyltransferase YjiC (YdhE family)
MLSISHDLVARGNRVTVITGAVNAEAVRAAGAELHPLPANADLDDAQFDPVARGNTSAIAALNPAIIRMYLAPMARQAAELSTAMARRRFDAIIVDHAFFGVVPFLLGDRAGRAPVLYYAPTPLMLSSRDTAPPGMGLPPRAGTIGRLRNRALNLFSHEVVLRQSHRAANATLKSMGLTRLPVFLLDVGVLADRLLVPTVPTFEYPRSDLASNVRFVGPVRPSSHEYVRPAWWPELDGDRPVVHVTQGTVDNEDPTRLIEPTIEALAGDDVIVVATTGGRPVTGVMAAPPANTLVAEYIPHEILLPKVGRHGHQRWLRGRAACGVDGRAAGRRRQHRGRTGGRGPRRLGWRGHRPQDGHPPSATIRRAVHQVLGGGNYLDRARELETDFARRDGIAEIAALVDEVIGERRLRARAHPSHL